MIDIPNFTTEAEATAWAQANIDPLACAHEAADGKKYVGQRTREGAGVGTKGMPPELEAVWAEGYGSWRQILSVAHKSRTNAGPHA